MAMFAKATIGIWLALMLGYVFLRLPAAEGFASPELARVVALHLPNAYVAVIAAFTAGWFGARYLLKGRQPIDDVKSVVGAALAALFCLLTTVTGSIFASVQWHSYWNWDPRETSVFFLLLVYLAYFALRAGIEDLEKRARISAVYVLFASIMTPMLGYIIPKYMMSLHPTNVQFDTPYRIAIYGTAVGLLGLMVWMFQIAVRAFRVRLALLELEEERAWNQ